jgi:K+-sensing histidine kinase KdpD
MWDGTALLVLGAYYLRAEVFTALQPLPLLFFLPAIMVSAMLFGRACGVLATLLSAALAAYFFLPPIHSFAINSPNGALSLGLSMLTGLVIAVFGFGAAECLSRRRGYASADRSRPCAGRKGPGPGAGGRAGAPTPPG